jgi:predicted RecA/RadA family phage recombinase
VKNFVQRGDVIRLTAPAAVKSGDGILVNAIFGVCATDAGSGDDVECSTVGVFELPKSGAGGVSFDQGDAVFWDVSASLCVASAGAGNAAIGAATEAAGSSATTVRVRLDGTDRRHLIP